MKNGLSNVQDVTNRSLFDRYTIEVLRGFRWDDVGRKVGQEVAVGFSPSHLRGLLSLWIFRPYKCSIVSLEPISLQFVFSRFSDFDLSWGGCWGWGHRNHRKADDRRRKESNGCHRREGGKIKHLLLVGRISDKGLQVSNLYLCGKNLLLLQ